MSFLHDDRSMTVSSTASFSSDVESIDMLDDDLSIPAPPPTFSLSARKNQPSYKTRLFDEATEEKSLTPKAPYRRQNGHNHRSNPSTLQPLDLNNCLETKRPMRRKRSSEDKSYRHTPGRSRGDAYDANMYISPSPSSYITMDGRCVTSKNPFSPMMTDNLTPPKSAQKADRSNAAGSSPHAEAGASLTPFLPVSLDASQSAKKDRKALPQSPHIPPPTCRHRLQKRNNEDSSFAHYFTKDGFPEKSGRYSFTGSPIQESKNSTMMETADSPEAYNFKIRRLHTKDDVVVAAAAANSTVSSGLQIDTSAPVIHAMDEESPTDVMSFPTPPTPTKVVKSRRKPSLSPGPPQTPFLERRRRNPPTLLPSSGLLSRNRNEDDEDDSSHHHDRSELKSRFHSDFDIIGELGKGSFGTVYKVLSRLDGCMYAVKTALRKAKGNADRDRMLKEVYALAALSDQADTATFHIVRYHQAWMEDDRLYIQTELCTSTLADEVQSSQSLPHLRRYKLLREILLALEFIHRNEMVHLDIKPENIFLKNDQYKLGDFGLVTKISYHKDVEEGDSRYMSMELLSGDHEDLTKSDIFSLGATLYEICLGVPLPMNGQEWQDIRECKLQRVPDTPHEMEAIIRQMMNPTYASRPTASELLKRPQLLSEEQKALILERSKVLQANMALAAQAQQFQRSTVLPRTALPRSTLVRANTWTAAGPTSFF